MLRVSLALAIALSSFGSAAARDIFVNNLTGSDLSDGSAAQASGQGVGPVRTIRKALRLARKADRIVIGNTGQPYRECVTLQGAKNSGWPDSPFEIVGNGAVLDGSAAVPDRAWEHYHDGVFRFQPQRMAYQQLFHDGRPLERIRVAGHAELTDLEPMQWCLFDRYVYFRPEAGRLPPSYALTHCHETAGITLYQVAHVVISDLTVQGYQLDGINCHSNVHDGALVGITSRGNGRSGVSIGGASRATLAASLVGNNGAAQLRVEGYARVTILNNNLLDATAPKIVNEGATVIDAGEQNGAEAAAGNAL